MAGNGFKFNQFVFVYGTLRKNEPNHHWIMNKGLEFQFLGKAVTKQKFPLVIASKYNIPYVLDKPGFGNPVRGELYRTTDAMLQHLDILEDYPNHYIRREEPIELISNIVDSKEVSKLDKGNLKAWIYLLPNFRDDLLNLPFLTEYSSNGSHGLPYTERASRTEPFDYAKELYK